MEIPSLGDLETKDQLRAAALLPPADRVNLFCVMPHLIFLSDPEEVKIKDKHGRTIVHLIAERSLPEGRLLIELVCFSENFDLHTRDNTGRTPLMAAMVKRNWPVFELLLEMDPGGINIWDNQGDTPLHRATRHKMVMAVKMLLKQPALCINLQDNQGQTAIMIAVCKRYEKMATLLLTHPEIDVNIMEMAGFQPLTWAAESGLENLARILVSHKSVDVNAMDCEGWTALTTAIYNDEHTIRDILLATPGIDVNHPKDPYDSPLITAVARHKTDSLRALLARDDLEINAVDSDNWTALMWAANNMNPEGFRLLREHGADLDVESVAGETALSLFGSSMKCTLQEVRNMMDNARDLGL